MTLKEFMDQGCSSQYLHDVLEACISDRDATSRLCALSADLRVQAQRLIDEQPVENVRAYSIGLLGFLLPEIESEIKYAEGRLRLRNWNTATICSAV